MATTEVSGNGTCSASGGRESSVITMRRIGGLRRGLGPCSVGCSSRRNAVNRSPAPLNRDILRSRVVVLISSNRGFVVDALQPGDPQWVGRYRLVKRLGS